MYANVTTVIDANVAQATNGLREFNADGGTGS
jgi:hypothetical protein